MTHFSSLEIIANIQGDRKFYIYGEVVFPSQVHT